MLENEEKKPGRFFNECFLVHDKNTIWSVLVPPRQRHAHWLHKTLVEFGILVPNDVAHMLEGNYWKQHIFVVYFSPIHTHTLHVGRAGGGKRWKRVGSGLFSEWSPYIYIWFLGGGLSVLYAFRWCRLWREWQNDWIRLG